MGSNDSILLQQLRHVLYDYLDRGMVDELEYDVKIILMEKEGELYDKMDVYTKILKRWNYVRDAK